MSIPLPPLPDKNFGSAHMYPSDLEKFKTAETYAAAFSVAVGCPDETSVPLFTLDQLRARDLEVARCVLEAAAKVCDYWSKQNHVYVNGALRCAVEVSALELNHAE